MLTLPPDFSAFLIPFATLFTPSVFVSVRLLLAGAILTPGPRTVTAALRALGLAYESHFQNYPRVLNRAQWSPRAAAKNSFKFTRHNLCSDWTHRAGPGRYNRKKAGAKIRAKGIYHDPVRSSHSHFVKTSGLRWLSLMLLVPIPFVKRVWALPFLTALCPSQRYQQQYHPQCHTPKKLTHWARQVVSQARRWLPRRALVVVTDSSFAVIQLLTAWQRLDSAVAPFCTITRLRLDAGLYAPAPPRQANQMGQPRLKGQRLPTLKQILQDPQTLWTEPL